MNIFKAVSERSGQVDFDLFTFFEELSPRTCVLPYVVPMKAFNLDMVRDCILLNIAEQHLRLSRETTVELIDFLRDDFPDRTKKVAIQVLIHFTKMNVKLLQDRYLKAEENLPVHLKMTAEEYFDSSIYIFIEHARREWGDDAIVTPISKTSKTFLKKQLQKPAILEALCIALKDLVNDPHNGIFIEDIQKAIEEMEIYCTNRFAPLEDLRGACVLDGILLCTSNLAFETKTNTADMITLAAHVCSHYLARLFLNDFNFSKLCEQPRLDPVVTDAPMELGRCVELLLFDKIQPDWPSSSVTAAEVFLQRLESGARLPLLKNEHRKLRLRARPVASPPYFGIDMKDYDNVFC